MRAILLFVGIAVLSAALMIASVNQGVIPRAATPF